MRVVRESLLFLQPPLPNLINGFTLTLDQNTYREDSLTPSSQLLFLFCQRFVAFIVIAKVFGSLMSEHLERGVSG